jgi:hypothetical protein
VIYIFLYLERSWEVYDYFVLETKIDLEWLGNDKHSIQTNYYVNHQVRTSLKLCHVSVMGINYSDRMNGSLLDFVTDFLLQNVATYCSRGMFLWSRSDLTHRKYKTFILRFSTELRIFPILLVAAYINSRVVDRHRS